jgi:hypothetical protein
MINDRRLAILGHEPGTAEHPVPEVWGQSPQCNILNSHKSFRPSGFD